MGAGDNDNPRNNVFFIDQSVDDDLSEACHKQHLDICGVMVPSGFEGTAITFQGSVDGTTFGSVTWLGVEVSVPVTAGDAAKFPKDYLDGFSHVKLGSNANESADRTLTPIYRDFAR